MKYIHTHTQLRLVKTQGCVCYHRSSAIAPSLKQKGRRMQRSRVCICVWQNLWIRDRSRWSRTAWRWRESRGHDETSQVWGRTPMPIFRCESLTHTAHPLSKKTLCNTLLGIHNVFWIIKNKSHFVRWQVSAPTDRLSRIIGTLHYITCHLADAFIQSDLQ